MSDGLSSGIGHGDGLRNPPTLGSGDRDASEPIGLDIRLMGMSGDRDVCWENAERGLLVEERRGASRAMAVDYEAALKVRMSRARPGESTRARARARDSE
jgi:hypothetical protein